MVDLKLAVAALRNVWGPLPQGGTGALRPALQTRCDAAFAAVVGGSVQRMSGNGQDVSFFTPSMAQMSPQDVVDMWVFLVERFDTQKLTLQTAGNANPTDLQVETSMEADMRPVFGYTDNWMFMTK